MNKLRIAFILLLGTIFAVIAENPNYSVNLMWINSRLGDQEHICPKDQPCVAKMFEWAVANPEAEINLWYDSELTPAHAVENTRKEIEEKHSKNMAPIRLQDIRDLPEVKKNREVFSDSRIPVYFRADLARVIAAYNTIVDSKTDNFVYADLDLDALSQKQLFDQETNQNLERYGMVMAKYGNRFENGFFILKNNKNLLDATKLAMIDLNIERAHNAFNGKFSNVLRRQPNGPFRPLEQVVYDSYSPMFEYFYHLEGCGTCHVFWDWAANTGEIYDKDTHGLRPFGPHSLGDKHIHLIPEKDWCGEKHDIFVPRKNVNYPSVSGDYSDK